LLDFLGFRLMMSIVIEEKIFASSLAFGANRFMLLFNDIPLAVTFRTNHFCLLINTARKRITRAGLRDPSFYMRSSGGWQGKNKQDYLC
jgi:hypothetical protein